MKAPGTKGTSAMRRRTLFSSALAATAAIGLAACDKKGSSGASTTTAKGGGAIDAVTVSGEMGAEPKVSFQAPLSITASESKLIAKGSDGAIAEGDYLALHTLYVNAADGSVLQSAWQGGPANYLSVNVKSNGQEVVDFLKTATIGSRIVMVGNLQDQTQQTIGVVQVSDILGKALARATGAPQPATPGMPAVTVAENGAPSVTLDGVAAPETTQAAVTILGDGEKTAQGDALAMHYTGWKLSDGSPFDSSWDRGEPFSFVLGAGRVITGWDQGLVDRTVGSQVVLVIPPAEAYGAKEQSSHELAGETLVFVADILDAAKPAQA